MNKDVKIKKSILIIGAGEGVNLPTAEKFGKEGFIVGKATHQSRRICKAHKADTQKPTLQIA